MAHPRLTEVLSLRYAVLVEDSQEAASLVDAQMALPDSSPGGKVICGYISERGRVLAWRASDNTHVLFGTKIELLGGDDFRDTRGSSIVYYLNTANEEQICDDAKRLFLAQSIENGAVRRFAGWRDRVVALIPEEVGLKEANTFRTLSDGSIEVTHTYNVLDAVAKYAEWVGDLAAEFGTTDERIATGIESPDISPLWLPQIVQSWLLREAADAQLSQARASLRYGLGALAVAQESFSQTPQMSVAELARSLHTDRPNLSRAIKSATADPDLREHFAKIKAQL